MEKEFMVTEEELKKYQVFDKIEKKELSHYLLLEEAVEYIYRVSYDSRFNFKRERSYS